MLLTYVIQTIPFHLLFLFPFTLIFEVIFFPNYSLTKQVLLLWFPLKFFSKLLQQYFKQTTIHRHYKHASDHIHEVRGLNLVEKSWLLSSSVEWMTSVKIIGNNICL